MHDDRFGPELSLPDGWQEEQFERTTVEGVEAIQATVTTEDCSVAVHPVRYERRDGVDQVSGVNGGLEYEGLGLDVYGPETVRQRICFAVQVRFTPHSSERSAVYTVTADADDAFAVACWLARTTESGRAMEKHLAAHGGSHTSPGPLDRLSDDEALAARLPDEPEKCLFTGSRTRSHDLTVPFRYAPALDGFPRTDTGLPRVPTAVRALETVVSHGAWEERSVPDLEDSLEREGSGQYRLSRDAWDVLSDGDGTRVAVGRIGE